MHARAELWGDGDLERGSNCQGKWGFRERYLMEVELVGR